RTHLLAPPHPTHPHRTPRQHPPPHPTTNTDTTTGPSAPTTATRPRPRPRTHPTPTTSRHPQHRRQLPTPSRTTTRRTPRQTPILTRRELPVRRSPAGHLSGSRSDESAADLLRQQREKGADRLPRLGRDQRPGGFGVDGRDQCVDALVELGHE